MPPSNRHMITPKFVIGVFLVLMGVVLTLDQLGLVQAHHALRFWPVLLIILGLVTLQRCDRSGVVRALVLIVVGVWLLLNTLGLVSLQIWEFIWPLVLVFIGARIMMRNQGSGPKQPADQIPAVGAATGSIPPASAGPSVSAAASVNPANPVHASLFALMGSSKRRWGKNIFRGADTTSIMGGCELDLREALIDSQEPAVVDVFAIMGGVVIFVPANWTVSQEVVPLMGGVEDKTRSVPSNPPQHLLIRGTVIMGGIEINN
jgi:predicted membrane protein